MKSLLAAALGAALLVACKPDADPASAVPTDIPEALRGGWGITAADCEPGRDDAKGLMVVGPDRVNFYESRAGLAQIYGGGRERIDADFDFVGEDQTWSRRMILELRDNGRSLVRRDSGAGAAPEDLLYQACEA